MGADQGRMTVDADFPAGNIILDRVEGDHILVHQDVRDTEGDWFWWYFRVRGAAGRTLDIEFTKSAVIGSMGPLVSVDGGVCWSWFGPEKVQQNRRFSYAVPGEAPEVRFAFSYPYVQADFEAWRERHASDSHLVVEELCRSRKGRSVERVRQGPVHQPGDGPEPRRPG